MATLNQIVSELVHAMGHPNNIALRENVKLLVIQTRNELIRRSFENHSYIDRGLQQRFRVNLIDCNDGDIQFDADLETPVEGIKRTQHTVPRPVRLVNNLPFDRVSTSGYKTNKEIPFVKETSARFTDNLPGMCGMPKYDYINGYIYIFPANDKPIEFNKITIESAFEHPTPIEISNGLTDELEALFDNNEYLIPEDMIGNIKDIVYKRDLLNTFRETNQHSINTDVI